MPNQLVRALRASMSIDDYMVGVRQRQAVSRQLTGDRAQSQHESRVLDAQVFVDREFGRGHSRFFVPSSAPLQPLIQHAAERALQALGPAWRLRPPSAPARLNLVDSTWDDNLFEANDQVWQQFQTQLPGSLQLLEGSIALEFVYTRAILSNGFDNQYRSAKAQITAQVQASGGAPVSILMQARRLKDLLFGAVFEDAVRRSLQARDAVPNESGACDLLLLSSAYLPQAEDDFGLWTPLSQQCAASLAASGLARYQIGQEILAKPVRGDLLSIRSDGTRPFGLRSAPFDQDGQAVRRFSMIEGGLAAGQSIDYRHAARQGVEANGGVRDLIMDSGTQTLAELATPGSRPLLVVHSLSELQTEARGALCLRVANSERRVRDAAGSTQTQATRGGVLSGNLYHWLQDAHFSSERNDLLWFDGPQAIRFNELKLRA